MEKYIKYTYSNGKINLFIKEEEADIFTNTPVRLNINILKKVETPNEILIKKQDIIKKIDKLIEDLEELQN
jgi:hypothetical protein